MFCKGKHISTSLFFCALIDGLVAAGIYYVSHESFSSAFITHYIMPYAQIFSFITPVIWAVCYLIASIFAVSESQEVSLLPDKSVILTKDQWVYIGKNDKALSKLRVGLGWTLESEQYDLDLSAFILAANDKVAREKDFLYYNNKVHESGAVIVSSDSLEGGGGINDNEHIDVDLGKVPSYAQKSCLPLRYTRRKSVGRISGRSEARLSVLLIA